MHAHCAPGRRIPGWLGLVPAPCTSEGGRTPVTASGWSARSHGNPTDKKLYH